MVDCLESQNIISQYITALSGLKDKLSEVGQQTEEYQQIEDEMKTAKDGLISILGEEQTALGFVW